MTTKTKTTAKAKKARAASMTTHSFIVRVKASRDARPADVRRGVRSALADADHVCGSYDITMPIRVAAVED